MTVANPAQDLVDEEFSEIYRPIVPAGLKRAYASADEAIERIGFLQSPSGKFHRGDLIVLAVELEFEKLVKEGHLPFEISWESYAAPTGKHLVLKSPRANITFNQVEYPHQKPRFASFRKSFAVPNTEYLFPEMKAEFEADKGLKHIALLHGHSELRFANLAVPHPSANKLMYWTNNLLSLPHHIDVFDTKAKGEGPVFSPDAELVDDIVKKVHDSSRK